MKRKLRLLTAIVGVLLVIAAEVLHAETGVEFGMRTKDLDGSVWREGNIRYHFNSDQSLTVTGGDPQKRSQLARWEKTGNQVVLQWETNVEPVRYRIYEFRGEISGNTIKGDVRITGWDPNVRFGPVQRPMTLTPVGKWPPELPVKLCKPIVRGPQIIMPPATASLSHAMGNIGLLPSVSALRKGIFQQVQASYAQLESDRLVTGDAKDNDLAAKVMGAQSGLETLEDQSSGLAAKKPSHLALNSYRDDYESLRKKLSWYNSTIRNPSDPPLCLKCGKRHISQKKYDEETAKVESTSALLRRRAEAFKGQAESYVSDVKRFKSQVSLLEADLKELLADITRRQKEYFKRIYKPVESWSLEASLGTLTQVDRGGKEVRVVPGMSLTTNVEYATKEDSSFVLNKREEFELDDGKSLHRVTEMVVAPNSSFSFISATSAALKALSDAQGGEDFLSVHFGRFRHRVEFLQKVGPRVRKWALTEGKDAINRLIGGKGATRVVIPPGGGAACPRATDIVYEVNEFGATISVIEGSVEWKSLDGEKTINIDAGQQVLFKPDGTQVRSAIQPREVIRQWRQTTLGVEAVAYNKRGEAALGNGDYERAIDLFSQALYVNPRYIPAFTNRGNAWMKTRAYAKAVDDFRSAIDCDRQNAAAYARLASLLATCPEKQYRDGKAAIANALKACQLSDFKKSEHLDTLAASYACGGDFDSAIHWQRKAIDLAPLEKLEDYFARRDEYLKAKADLEWADVPLPGSEKEVTKLQGSWLIRSLSIGGKPVTVPVTMKLVFRESLGRFEAFDVGKNWEPFRIHADQAPKGIDFRDGVGTGYGIYSLDGDELELCVSDRRPDSFTTKPGTQDTLVVLHRVTEKLQAQIDEQIRRFQGNWIAVSGMISGKDIPDVAGMLYVFKDNTFQVRDAKTGRTSDWLSFYINPLSTPKQIDVVGVEVDDAKPDRPSYQLDHEKQTESIKDVKFSPGIYEFEGDLLRICSAETRQDDRPKSLLSQNKDQYSVVLKRIAASE